MYDLVFAALSEPVCVVAGDQIVTANAAFLTLVGRFDVDGTNFSDLICPSRREELSSPEPITVCFDTPTGHRETCMRRLRLNDSVDAWMPAARPAPQSAACALLPHFSHDARNSLSVLYQAVSQVRKRAANGQNTSDLLAILDDEAHRIERLLRELSALPKDAVVVTGTHSLDYLQHHLIASLGVADVSRVTTVASHIFVRAPFNQCASLLSYAVWVLLRTTSGQVAFRLVEDANRVVLVLAADLPVRRSLEYGNEHFAEIRNDFVRHLADSAGARFALHSSDGYEFSFERAPEYK